MIQGKTSKEKAEAWRKAPGTRLRAGLKRPLTELEIRLRHWGRTFGPPPPKEWDEDKSETRGARLPIMLGGKRSAIMTLTNEPVIHGKWLRSALGDREFVPSRWTAKGSQSKGGPGVWNPPPDADEVEMAMLELYRTHPIRACTLRAHYCLRLSRPWGAWKTSEWLGERLTKTNYSRELDLARAWVAGRLRLSDNVKEPEDGATEKDVAMRY